MQAETLRDRSIIGRVAERRGREFAGSVGEISR